MMEEAPKRAQITGLFENRVLSRIEEATGGVVSRMELLYPESQHGAADGVIPDHNVLYPKILFFCCISIAFVPEEERCEK